MTSDVVTVESAKNIQPITGINSIVLELAIAGTFESVEIVLSGPSNNNIVYPLMMWIPAVPAILLLIMLFRRINHDEYKPKDKDIDTFNFENV